MNYLEITKIPLLAMQSYETSEKRAKFKKAFNTPQPVDNQSGAFFNNTH